MRRTQDKRTRDKNQIQRTQSAASDLRTPKERSVLRFPVVLMLALAGLSGCYHTKVTTGLTPSAQVYEIPFAHSFVYGLVPPEEVRGAERCPSGVAIVESEISFVNGLVAALTFSLYTPMHIKVTCAASSAMTPSEGGSPDLSRAEQIEGEDIVDQIGRAADRAAATGRPVYLDVSGR